MNNTNNTNNINNNIDISQMLNMLSKMDRTQLEQGMKKANQILQSKNKDDILKDLNFNKKI